MAPAVAAVNVTASEARSVPSGSIPPATASLLNPLKSSVPSTSAISRGASCSHAHNRSSSASSGRIASSAAALR